LDSDARKGLASIERDISSPPKPICNRSCDFQN
jgi:hypothetical protein